MHLSYTKLRCFIKRILGIHPFIDIEHTDTKCNKVKMYIERLLLIPIVNTETCKDIKGCFLAILQTKKSEMKDLLECLLKEVANICVCFPKENKDELELLHVYLMYIYLEYTAE
jgi:hypothetical protein